MSTAEALACRRSLVFHGTMFAQVILSHVNFWYHRICKPTGISCTSSVRWSKQENRAWKSILHFLNPFSLSHFASIHHLFLVKFATDSQTDLVKYFKKLFIVNMIYTYCIVVVCKGIGVLLNVILRFLEKFLSWRWCCFSLELAAFRFSLSASYTKTLPH